MKVWNSTCEERWWWCHERLPSSYELTADSKIDGCVIKRHHHLTNCRLNWWVCVWCGGAPPYRSQPWLQEPALIREKKSYIQDQHIWAWDSPTGLFWSNNASPARHRCPTSHLPWKLFWSQSLWLSPRFPRLILQYWWFNYLYCSVFAVFPAMFSTFFDFSLTDMGLSQIPHIHTLICNHNFMPFIEFIWIFLMQFQVGLFHFAYLVAIFDTMASQDWISQFTRASPMIPASQPDRSRTPPPHQEWHQSAPTFRGPMHYAMAASRPMWLHQGVPPPPPQHSTLSFPSRPSWTTSPSTPSFPPTPPVLPHGPQDYSALTPQRCGIPTPRSPPSTTSPPGVSPVRQGYTCRPIDIPPVEGWKPDVDYHDSNKVNGLDFPSKIRQSKFSGFKGIEGMDPLQVPLWKFFTILGFVALPTEGKPLCSHLTISALRSSLQNWWPGSAPGMWI